MMSSGLCTIEDKQFPRTRAQRSLAPLGTCCSVGILYPLIIEREGREGIVVTPKVESTEAGGVVLWSTGPESSVPGLLAAGGAGARAGGSTEWPVGPVFGLLVGLGRSVGAEVPRGKVLWHLPESPGKQLVQRVSPLTQAHLRHLAVPLQWQQWVTGREGAGGPLGRIS